MIPQHFHYLKLIARFIYARIIKGNELLLAASVVLGVLGRVLMLGGFAMTLQAIVAAIRPGVILRISNKIVAKLGMNFTIEAAYLIPLLMVLIILIYGGNFVVQYFSSKLMNRLNWRSYKDQRNFAPERSLDEDIFIIEQVPIAAQSVGKCLEIGVFIIMVITLIAFLAPGLALLLLPLLAVLVVIQVFGDRVKLRDLKQQVDARGSYINEPILAGKVRRRTAPKDGAQRDAYLAIREHRRHRIIIKPHSDSIVGAMAIVLIIYYLSSAKLSSVQLAGMLILFVIGIRNVIAAGRELSVNVSRILELRKHIAIVSTLTSADRSDS